PTPRRRFRWIGPFAPVTLALWRRSPLTSLCPREPTGHDTTLVLEVVRDRSDRRGASLAGTSGRRGPVPRRPAQRLQRPVARWRPRSEDVAPGGGGPRHL